MDFFTPAGVGILVTFIIGAFNIKKLVSPMVVNILAIILAVIFSFIGYLSIKGLETTQDVFISLKNGLEAGFISIGFYEGYKNIKSEDKNK